MAVGGEALGWAAQLLLIAWTLLLTHHSRPCSTTFGVPSIRAPIPGSIPATTDWSVAPPVSKPWYVEAASRTHEGAQPTIAAITTATLVGGWVVSGGFGSGCNGEGECGEKNSYEESGYGFHGFGVLRESAVVLCFLGEYFCLCLCLCCVVECDEVKRKREWEYL
ncbi:unnamed protein product [Camellia sinensis]